MIVVPDASPVKANKGMVVPRQDASVQSASPAFGMGDTSQPTMTSTIVVVESESTSSSTLASAVSTTAPSSTQMGNKADTTPNSPAPSTAATPSSPKSKSGVIAAACIGGFAVLIIALVILLLDLRRRRRNKDQNTSSTNSREALNKHYAMSQSSREVPIMYEAPVGSAQTPWMRGSTIVTPYHTPAGLGITISPPIPPPVPPKPTIKEEKLEMKEISPVDDRPATDTQQPYRLQREKSIQERQGWMGYQSVSLDKPTEASTTEDNEYSEISHGGITSGWSTEEDLSLSAMHRKWNNAISHLNDSKLKTLTAVPAAHRKTTSGIRKGCKVLKSLSPTLRIGSSEHNRTMSDPTSERPGLFKSSTRLDSLAQVMTKSRSPISGRDISWPTSADGTSFIGRTLGMRDFRRVSTVPASETEEEIIGQYARMPTHRTA